MGLECSKALVMPSMCVFACVYAPSHHTPPHTYDFFGGGGSLCMHMCAVKCMWKSEDNPMVISSHAVHLVL